MQIAILNGIYTNEAPDFRTSYPVNLVPVPKDQGISKGYLRPADGIVEFATGPGTDRGGINWNGVMYRVMGTKLVSISDAGVVTELGDVGGAGQVTMDYSFDRLGISSSERLYYWDGATLTWVSDPDLGPVLDFIWIDGYFMTTDGENLVVTELADPTSVDPLKYGSSEVDPDPVIGILKLQDEAYAMNRYTIEVFDNIGGDGFPFQRIDGAQVEKGIVGTYAACVFGQTIAFLGSGRNEALAVYRGAHSETLKISSREVDQILTEYTEEELADTVMEARIYDGHQCLWMHLPDRTMVFDSAASEEVGSLVWYQLTSATQGFSQYRAKNLVQCYGRWYVGDPTTSKIGYLDADTSHQYGDLVRWEFGTTIVYNQGKGAIFHELELVALTGRVEFGTDPQISTSYSIDGVTWSQEKYRAVGEWGNRTRRIVWLQQGWMRNWRIQRFQGDSSAHLAFARLEATIEALAF